MPVATLARQGLLERGSAGVGEVTVEVEALLRFLAPASARHEVVVLPFA